MTTRFRSFGLTAHVDAGKTTLAERILYVCGRVHRPGSIDGDRPTTLDHTTVERQRGITIAAAATTVAWGGHTLSIVDTPGHVDFTIEVERALRVLDGAVLVLCGVAGVQAQTRTVERQMARYGVPRIAFVNKCDHPAADPVRAVDTLRTRLGVHPALVQWPIRGGPDGSVEAGLHRSDTAVLIGVVDLVHRRAWTFADEGRVAEPVPVPAVLLPEVERARERLVDAVSLVDAGLVEVVLAGRDPSGEELADAVRRATCARSFVPVLLGSAARGIGVQPLLDAVVRYLPAPGERAVEAIDPNGTPERLSQDGPLVSYVFKTEDTDHGAWTWVRVYRGTLVPGMSVIDGRTSRRHRIGRLGRLHGAVVERVAEASAGEIVAVFGLDVPSGTTLCDPAAPRIVEAFLAPEPVVERSVTLVTGDRSALAKGLGQLVRDDPTLRVTWDDEAGETRIRGMGELHLEVAAQLLSERYRVEVALGDPRVAYRQALAGPASFDHLLRKQSGGPGMYARLVGHVRPADTFSFAWEVVGGAVPQAYRSVVERAFREEAASGAGRGWPLVGIAVVVTDGAIHSRDSNERAFEMAAKGALRQVLETAGTVVLEPVMRVVVEAPETRPGVLAGLLLARGGVLLDAGEVAGMARVEATAPLAQMFGFSAALRSATAGAGTFQMEFGAHRPR